MTRRRFAWRRWLLAGLLVLSVFAASCRTVERYLPEIIAVTGTVIEIAGLNYNDGQYALEVSLLMGALVPAGTIMAANWVEDREQARELAELEAIQAEIDAEYAALEQGPPPSQSWTTADGAPMAAQAPPETWTNVAPQPQFQYGMQPVSAAGQAMPQPQGYQAAFAPTSTQPVATQPAPQAPAPAPGSSPWGDQYQAKGVPSALGEGPVGLDVALLKQGPDGAPVAIADRATLFDGTGEDATDRLQVFFRPTRQAHVYVVAIDATGRVQPLFPTRYPDGSNPVPAGQPVLLPGPGAWFGLDEHVGLQHVFFYASEAPNRKLLAQLARFANNAPPTPPAQPARVEEPTYVEGPEIRTRGLTGTGAPVEIGQADGSALSFEATRALAGAEGQDLAVTRVFEHR